MPADSGDDSAFRQCTAVFDDVQGRLQRDVKLLGALSRYVHATSLQARFVSLHTASICFCTRASLLLAMSVCTRALQALSTLVLALLKQPCGGASSASQLRVLRVSIDSLVSRDERKCPLGPCSPLALLATAAAVTQRPNPRSSAPQLFFERLYSYTPATARPPSPSPPCSHLPDTCDEWPSHKTGENAHRRPSSSARWAGSQASSSSRRT